LEPVPLIGVEEAVPNNFFNELFLGDLLESLPVESSTSSFTELLDGLNLVGVKKLNSCFDEFSLSDLLDPSVFLDGDDVMLVAFTSFEFLFHDLEARKKNICKEQ
jgi:hypothetical protein